MPHTHSRAIELAAVALLLTNTAALGCQSKPEAAPARDGVRVQDNRVFAVDAAALPFDALDGVASDRFWGVLGAAGYQIEVPANWNGMLVMYAHGHRQTPETLTVSTPTLRAHLVGLGYAWAASSYSANFYDVRAGVEDTNALALAFTALAAEHGRKLAEPSRIYITGRSMGGHVAGAAVEAETWASARHRVRYRGALPMCGVMADTELMNYYAAYPLAAFELAGRTARGYPIEGYDLLLPEVKRALWENYPNAVTSAGEMLRVILMNLSGGSRPAYDVGFPAWQDRLLSLGAGREDLSAPDLSGVLNRNVIDTTGVVYRFGSQPEASPDEVAFNARVFRVGADPEANRARRDGLRWVPILRGEFDVPVLTLHGLGDLYVPLSMVQIYARRARTSGSADWLVQRAIRSADHCDFTSEEEAAAFDALIAWEQQGRKPAGDDVLDPAALSKPAFGCAFTQNSSQPVNTRSSIPACN